MVMDRKHRWVVRGLAGGLFVFSGVAFFGSLLLWGEGFLLDPPADLDLAFPVADILVNAPASFVAAMGLWRERFYGYTAAQFTAGLYTYASVEIFVDVLQGGLPASAEILAPQLLAVLIAAALVLYLGGLREAFR